MTDEKWVNVEDYLGKGAIDQQKDRMSEAQEVDAYLRRGGIHSVEIKASGPNHLPKIMMTINRHQELRAHNNDTKRKGRGSLAGPHVRGSL